MCYFLEISLPDQVKQASYYVEDGELVITTGSTGAGIKRDSLKKLILEGLQDNSYSTTKYEIPTYVTYPESLNIDNIYNEVHEDVANAYFTTNPYAIYAENIGVDFNVDEVKQTVTEVGTNTEYRFKLNYTMPEVTVDSLGMEAFPNLLGTYSTNYVNNVALLKSNNIIFSSFMNRASTRYASLSKFQFIISSIVLIKFLPFNLTEMAPDFFFA